MTASAQQQKRHPLAILQIHERFDGSAKDQRVVRLINHWDGKARHDLLLAEPGADDARAGINPNAEVRFLSGPPIGQPGGPGRFLALAQLMRGYDLILSFGWGAFDAVIAHRMFGLLMNLPPLIHHEEGRMRQEAGALGFSGDFYRRFALSAAHALVVPSGEGAEPCPSDPGRHRSGALRRPVRSCVASRSRRGWPGGPGCPDRRCSPGRS